MELKKKTNLEDFITEVTLGNDKNFDNIFNLALEQVFSQSFLKKINNSIKRKIRFKEFNNRNQNIIAFNRGNAIYINKIPFEKLAVKSKIQYILHEFIHILQRKKKIFFFKDFKEINDLTDNLVPIMEKHLVKPLQMFLTKRNLNIGPGGKHEILGYLMNNSIDWTALSKEGKKLFIDELKKSQIFNLSHPFWRNRLF